MPTDSLIILRATFVIHLKNVTKSWKWILLFYGGKAYLINFVLLHYIFRIYLLKEINIEPKKNVEKFLKSVYDWVNSLKNDNFQDYKSVSYSMRLIFKHFN